MKRGCIFVIAYLGLCLYLATTGHWGWLLLGIIVGGICGFLYFMAYSLAAGFRNKFPLDFVSHIKWVNDYFVQKGFTLLEHRGAGSDYPESVFIKDETRVRVRLNAPLMTTKPLSITVFINNGATKEWTFAVDADREQLFYEFDDYLSS